VANSEYREIGQETMIRLKPESVWLLALGSSALTTLTPTSLADCRDAVSPMLSNPQATWRSQWVTPRKGYRRAAVHSNWAPARTNGWSSSIEGYLNQGSSDARTSHDALVDRGFLNLGSKAMNRCPCIPLPGNPMPVCSNSSASAILSTFLSQFQTELRRS